MVAPKKLISLITGICFLYSSVFFSVIEAAITSPCTQPACASQNLEQSLIPLSIGSITSSKDFKSDLSVITIQDLHCHAQVQKNISIILSALDKKYDLKNVYVEGGYGDVDTSWFEGLPESSVKHNIAKSLIDSGRLTGSEYYSITSHKPHLLKGLEDEKLHAENIIRLGTVLGWKKSFELSTRQLDDDITLLRARYLNHKNNKLNTLIERYKNHRITPQKYYRLLQAYVDEINARPDTYNCMFKIRMTNYPNTTAYLDLLESENHLNYPQINRQLHDLISELKSILPYNAYNALARETDSFTNNDTLYETLALIAQDHHVNLARYYPDLNHFLDYRHKKQTINPVQLIHEEKRLIEELRVALSKDVNEVEISFLSDFYDTFKDYLFNRLSANDYDYFVSRFDMFKRIWKKYTYSNHLSVLEPAFATLDEYYRVNNTRTDRFVETILKDNSSKVIVMVTGGYHSEGLQKLLEERKISYCTITPTIVSGPTDSRTIYQDIIKQQASVFARHALSYKLYTQMAPRMWVTADNRVLLQFNTGETVEFAKDGTVVKMMNLAGNSAAPETISHQITAAAQYGVETAVTDVRGQIELLKEMIGLVDLVPQ
ncbi:MAG: hypothetical protein ABSH12_09110, partial [Endomicrobiales bacterium]